MTAPTLPNTATRRSDSSSEESEGLTALAGAAVAGLVLAMGFVALMARVGGPAPVQASVDTPLPVVAPTSSFSADSSPADAAARVQSLYGESGAH